MTMHQGAGWDVRRDSPLLAFTDADDRRARFSIATSALAALPTVDRLLAGAVDVDITPPPGMPKAGYSANAHNGTGFRTRLRARVLHLRAGSASVALVQCDLLGGSAVVQHLVARAIAESTDVPLAGLFIGATHTHAGPGQYLGTDFYNRFASNRSGFDPAFTQFLVERIAGGVQRAVDTRAPARLAIGTTDVWGSTRNRSLDAHVRNAGADHRTTPERKFYAINPALHLIRVDVDAGSGSTTGSDPLAAMVVFSVHGTGVPMRAREYNADIWAYLVGELGDRIEATHGIRPVVGAVEGTHADVAPAIRPGRAGHLEAARVGRTIGARAAELYEALASDLAVDIALQTGGREVDLDHDRSIDGVTLPYRPAVGAALVAGAHENLTPVVHRIPPFKAGTPKPWAGRAGSPHGAKWVIGSRWLQPLVIPRKSFPRILPIQTIRIGPAMLVGLPFEITVESGRRIAEAVGEAVDEVVGEGIDRVIVSSVANEYSGYVASPEEYERQHYEGAHTLYGPDTEPFLAAHAARLAAETVTGDVVQDGAGVRSFDLRIHHHLPGPPDGSLAIHRRLAGPPEFVDPTGSTDGYWELTWFDVAPTGLDWHCPLVSVERAGVDAPDDWEPFVDDQGWAMQVTHIDADDAQGAGVHRYTARWWDPTFDGAARFRFVLVPNRDRPEVASSPFP